jgi:hypothetical protein
MPQNVNPIVYKCTACTRVVPRSDLLAKRVAFTTIKPVHTVRSRVVAWLCSACRDKDPAWTAPAYASTPGGQQQRTAE